MILTDKVVDSSPDPVAAQGRNPICPITNSSPALLLSKSIHLSVITLCGSLPQSCQPIFSTAIRGIDSFLFVFLPAVLQPFFGSDLSETNIYMNGIYNFRRGASVGRLYD